MEITLETLHTELKELRQEVVDSRIQTTKEVVDSGFKQLRKWLIPGFKQLSGLSVSLWGQSSRLHPLLACIRR